MSEQAQPVRYHATPTGQVRECHATKRRCPRNPLLHGDTKEEVEAIIREGLETKHGPFAQIYRPRRRRGMVELQPGEIFRNNHVITEQEAKVVEDLAKKTRKSTRQRFHRDRYDLKGGDPKIAEERLNKAREYADKQNNPHLLQEVREADTVLASGKFSKGEGENAEEFTSDDYLNDYVKQKRVKEEREKLEEKIKDFASRDDVEPKRYEIENDDNKVIVDIKDGQVDEDFLATLPKPLQRKLTKPELKVDINKAREHLSKEQLADITTKSSKIDVIIGRERIVGQYVVEADTELEGETNKEKLESGMENLSQVYSDAKASFGETQRDIKKRKDKMNSAMKDVVRDENKTGNPTYIPARAKGNGLIATNTMRVNQNAAVANLSKDELKKVSVVERKANESLARTCLEAGDITQEQFDKLFGKRKVTVTVREK
jgi:hypothetical protein